MSSKDNDLGEENVDVSFEPIVSLPLVEIPTFEEDESCIFKARAKLFRFHKSEESAEWKERGTGDLKILRHAESHHSRIMMRRDKTLKVCANHYIVQRMQLKPSAFSDRAFIWRTTSDFADELAKDEVLGVRFASREIANEFKSKFEDCQDYNLSDSSKATNTVKIEKKGDCFEEVKHEEKATYIKNLEEEDEDENGNKKSIELEIKLSKLELEQQRPSVTESVPVVSIIPSKESGLVT